MKLLITGIPGMRKTTIGDYLQSDKGYQHFDMELREGTPAEFFDAVNRFLAQSGDDKVITWGFVPGPDDGLVRHFQRCGYKMIWFDGNREAALKAYLKAGRDKHLFDLQIGRINKMDLSIFHPVVLNTFDGVDVDSKFLAEEHIVSLILEKCG
jgi:hypothetical protein